ncbi:uncharacterized protein Tco025E_04505 [Trypanosoma conorhini]|uniref:Uncharacterized protein n=1 Tax=Trypanosoma conorhini TaxID=83891 RepID=A0A3R7N940_9TRYP|nr:uncharacterized protein Tco025E_04505 [Trypanosoma conorhini]RNF18388.1 hypothetical protein Tco025E_04505 [Trypanosoma conorhini]
MPPSSAAAASRTYLQDRVQRHYLEVLPSRWRAVLSRLAKNTQLRQKADVVVDNNLLSDIQADFDLIHALLAEEHRIYREGVTCLCSPASSGEAETRRLAAAQQLMQGMLSCIAMKELLIAHWKGALLDTSPSTLRVYCHACISNPHVSATNVERLLALYTLP